LIVEQVIVGEYLLVEQIVSSCFVLTSIFRLNVLLLTSNVICFSVFFKEIFSLFVSISTGIEVRRFSGIVNNGREDPDSTGDILIDDIDLTKT
jgi:hypothetical protein